MPETYTISELAQECKCSKTTIKKHLLRKHFASTSIVRNGKQVQAYALNDKHLKELVTLISMNKNTEADVKHFASTSDTTETPNIIELQEKYAQKVQSEKTLQDLLSSREKELQKLINEKVLLDANLKVAQSELKYIEDKSNTLTGELAREKQEKEQLQATVTRRNKQLIVTGALLLCTVVSIVVGLASAFIK